MRLLFALFLLLCGIAWADPVTVPGEGTGPTREAAVTKALVSAIEQATGVAIDEAQLSTMTGTSLATEASRDTIVGTTMQEAISRKAGGIVRSYRITSVIPAPEGGFVAEIEAVLEVFKPKASGEENRRRIAVALFDDGGAHGLGSQLRDSLLAYLTQTRRFAVVDRANDQAYAREMALINSQDAAPIERARAGQVIGADYVVTGKLRVVAARTTEQIIGLTGERVQHTTPGSASVDFQVIEIATRQVAWANTFVLPDGDSASLAARIGADIMQAIYPMRLIKFDDPQALVVNEGGIGVRVGQRLRAMLLGEVLVDPYTHERLGQTEQEIGIIEISDVQPKVSYARLVSGHLPSPGQEVVLRPAVSKPAPVQRTSRSSPAPAEPSGGVRLPFDR